VRLLFTLVTGNRDILECAPVLLIALQCQFLGSVKYIEDGGRTLGEYKAQERRKRASEAQSQHWM